jgi:hypothetical protein
MSLRVDTASLIPGMLVCGNRGLGVRGSQVPASGDAGPGFLYNDLSLPADADKEVRGLIVTPPAAGTLVVNEDSSFTFTAPDGVYSFVYRLFVDGADLGTTTVTLTVGVTAQIARPIADLSNTGWSPSTGADLYPMVGETVRDDGTYILATAVGALCELDLADLADPAVSTGHLPTLVLSAPGGGGITVRLRQGTTTIATWTYHPGASPTEVTPTLSGAEADSITDYTALRLQFEAIA